MYQPKPDKLLRAIAWGIYTGQIYQTEPSKAKAFVLPLTFGPDPEAEQLMGMYYEHISKIDRWVAGTPVFNSVQWLDEADATLVNRYVQWLESLKESFLSSSTGSWAMPILDRNTDHTIGPWPSSVLPVEIFTPEQ